MNTTSQKLKEKMLELTKLFCIERSLFQKLVIIYKYIKLLNKDPLAKNILQKIFDETADTVGEQQAGCFDEDEFLDVRGEAIFSREFWSYYTNLEVIHRRMKKIRKCKLSDKKDYDNLCKLFSKPYSKEMFDLSFKVVNSEVFERMDQECFINNDDKSDKTWFDEKNSILYIQGKAVKINQRNRITNAHKILKYIFITNKDNLFDDFYYAEIAEDEFNDSDYNSQKRGWEKYHVACREIQRKIKKQTNNTICDFLVFDTGKTGKVSLNNKYI